MSESPLRLQLYVYSVTFLAPKRRVRDVVGPSPAAALVERCVNVTDSLMARPNGSSAPATARQYGFQLPLLLKLFCNQSCGHQQVDMLSLLLGRSRPGRQLVKVFSASLVRIVRDDTSQLVAAPRQNALQAWTYHWTCCHGETIADWPCCGHVRGTDTAARCKGTGIGSIVAGRPSYGSGWRIEVTVGPYWLLAPNG